MPEIIENKLENKIKKGIEKLAQEYAHFKTDSLKSKQEAIERNKKELELFFLDDTEINESMNFSLDLFKRIDFHLFDEETISLMDCCMEKLKQEKMKLDNSFAPRELFGIKVEKLQEIYKIANFLYEKELYDSAKNLYVFIVMLDSTLTNSWIGLALCLEKLNQFENAFRIFSLLTLLNPTPDAYIYAIDCCLKIPNMQEAKELMHQLESLECNDQQKIAIKELKSKII